jgi:HEAT repeat protein
MARVRNIVLLVLTLTLVPVAARADYVVNVYEIRHEPDLGLITIGAISLRDEATHRTAVRKRATLSRRGLYLADEKQKVTHRRAFTLGIHSLKVALTIYPAAGHGYGGANWTASVVVEIDGVKKIDSVLGYDAPQGLTVESLTLHADGVIGGSARSEMGDIEVDAGERGFFNGAEELAKPLTTEYWLAALEKQKKWKQQLADEDALRESLPRLFSAASIPLLVRGLEHAVPRTAGAAAAGLGALGAKGAPAIGALGMALRRSHPSIANAAREALAAIGSASIPMLLEAIKEKDEHLRSQAAGALSSITPLSDRAAAALIEATRDPDWGVRRIAVTALGSCSKAAAIAALERALSDPQSQVRWDAANALRGIGPKASKAVPALKRALKDSEDFVRRAAKEALKAINRKPGED